MCNVGQLHGIGMGHRGHVRYMYMGCATDLVSLIVTLIGKLVLLNYLLL